MGAEASTPGPSPIYELRTYQVAAKDFAFANEIIAKKHAIRTRHSPLIGFWATAIGGGVTEVVHLWRYESLSDRRDVEVALKEDYEWAKDFLLKLQPLISSWQNVLLATVPGSTVDSGFPKEPTAVYLLDEVKVNSYKKPAPLPVNQPGEQLVARFHGILGPTKTEYRLWRYINIDDAYDAAKRRATETPFDGSTRLLYPAPFADMQ